MPGARYRDLMPGWAPECLPPEVPVLEIVSVWPLSGACRGDGSRSVSIAGCLPRWGGIGIFVWIFVAGGGGFCRDFGLLSGGFCRTRPPEFSGIAVCRRCGRDFVK